MLQQLKETLRSADAFCRQRGRPFITVTYAQSIDGSIALKNRRQVRLSGPDALRLTHELRSSFDAILVGIGTIISDNPRLTTRLAEGGNPRPLILDTHLRTPLGCRLLDGEGPRPWIVGGTDPPGTKTEALRGCGAAVFSCATDAVGRIDLPALMRLLAGKNVASVMVEGGARVITSFVHAGLIDQLVVTLTPKLLGGYPVIDQRGVGTAPYLRLESVRYQSLGDDMVLWAKPVWDRP
jgi:3,4-dihydroxy 2-butanone 4-phosphate synthase/GTP cyclohydrolase II